jgi:signal transduction histidine kinase
MQHGHFKVLRFLFLILLNSVITGSLQSQPQHYKKVDSLLKIIRSSNDTNAVSAYLDLSNVYYFNSQHDSAIYYSLTGISLSKKLHEFKLPRLLLSAGKCYYMKSLNDSAIYFLTQSKPFMKQATDEIKIQYNSILASVYLDQHKTDEALDLFIASASILEKPVNVHLKHKLFNAYANIGHTFLKERQYDKADEYFKKALQLKENAESKGLLIMIYNKYCSMYFETNELDKAQVVLDSAMVLLNQMNNLEHRQSVYVNYGRLYELRFEYAKAKEKYLVGLKITDSLKNDYYRPRILNNLSSVSISLNQIAGAEQYAKEALRYAQQFNSFQDINYAYGNYKAVAKARGNYKQALEFAELEFKYADSVSSTASKANVQKLEAKYENQKKENQIADLTIANNEKELTVVKRNRLLLIGGISAAAMLLAISLLYRNSKQKQLLSAKENLFQQEQIKFLERQQQVVSLQSMVNGQETERTRIAKDLHDGLGGLFSTIKMQLSTLKHEEKSLETNELFQKSYELVDNASVEVRRIAHNMMPEVLIKLGLVQAAQELCNSINAGKLMSVSMQSYGMEQRLNASTEMMLFRIVQELLNNIIKHAYASEAIIQFNRDGDRLSVTVEDNGRGFNLEDSSGKKAGLESVKSRVNYLNGKLSIDSEKEIGTTVLMDFLINEG